jgi:hypothetical protein
VRVDDPCIDDGVLDPGEQPYQLVEVCAVEAKFPITCGDCGPIDDRLHLVGAAIVYESPKRDRLLEKLPAIAGLIDDLDVFLQ